MLINGDGGVDDDDDGDKMIHLVSLLIRDRMFECKAESLFGLYQLNHMGLSFSFSSSILSISWVYPNDEDRDGWLLFGRTPR